MWPLHLKVCARGSEWFMRKGVSPRPPETWKKHWFFSLAKPLHHCPQGPYASEWAWNVNVLAPRYSSCLGASCNVLHPMSITGVKDIFIHGVKVMQASCFSLVLMEERQLEEKPGVLDSLIVAALVWCSLQELQKFRGWFSWYLMFALLIDFRTNLIRWNFI